MAKRPSSRNNSSTDDNAGAAPAAPKPRRARSSSRSTTSTSVQDASEAADMGDAPEQTEGAPSDDDIRTRAYHRFLERGGGHGQHFDDWIQAERELRGKK
jgi:Protein of unknown function (DUF2934)